MFHKLWSGNHKGNDQMADVMDGRGIVCKAVLKVIGKLRGRGLDWNGLGQDQRRTTVYINTLMKYYILVCVVPCSLLEIHACFGDTYCIHHQVDINEPSFSSEVEEFLAQLSDWQVLNLDIDLSFFYNKKQCSLLNNRFLLPPKFPSYIAYKSPVTAPSSLCYAI